METIFSRIVITPNPFKDADMGLIENQSGLITSIGNLCLFSSDKTLKAQVNPSLGVQEALQKDPSRLILDLTHLSSNDLIAVLEAETGISWETQPWVEGLRVG